MRKPGKNIALAIGFYLSNPSKPIIVFAEYLRKLRTGKNEGSLSVGYAAVRRARVLGYLATGKRSSEFGGEYSVTVTALGRKALIHYQALERGES